MHNLHPIAGHNSRWVTYPEMLAERLEAVQQAQTATDIHQSRHNLVTFVIRAFDHLTSNTSNRTYSIHLRLAADIVAQEWQKQLSSDETLRAICFILENHSNSAALSRELLPTAIQIIQDCDDPADQFHAIDLLMQTAPAEPFAKTLSALWDHVAETVPGCSHPQPPEIVKTTDFRHHPPAMVNTASPATGQSKKTTVLAS